MGGVVKKLPLVVLLLATVGLLVVGCGDAAAGREGAAEMEPGGRDGA